MQILQGRSSEYQYSNVPISYILNKPAESDKKGDDKKQKKEKKPKKDAKKDEAKVPEFRGLIMDKTGNGRLYYR